MAVSNVKIFLKDEDDDDLEEKDQVASFEGVKAFSQSMNSGGLSTRIPRFRRASIGVQSTKETITPINTSFDDSTISNRSDSGLGSSSGSRNTKGNKLKRYHSIYERGEQKREQQQEKAGRLSPIQAPLKRSKSPNTPRINPLALKRHKSFSAGERPNVSRRSQMTQMKTLVPLVQPPENSSDLSPTTPKPNMGRRGTVHTLSIATKEGILNMKPATKTTVVDDPGRVQVFVRIRPLNDTEDVNKHPQAVTVADEENTQLQLFDGKNDRCYQFDGVLPDTADNKYVYKSVGEPLVYSALSGFNGILMCYGQTGTGKTYSLMSNDGMSVRIMYQCFKVINKDKRHKYMVTCSYMQIYQEKIYDLLNETRTVELSLREHPKTGVYIENLTEYVVHSPKEVLSLLKVGRKRLVFAETKMNRVSSRSHAIIQLKILKERIGHSSEGRVSPSPYGVKTPDFDSDDDEDFDHDSFAGSMNDSFQALVDEDDENDEDILSNLTDLEDGVTSVRGKIYICDLAGSERIKKTKASGERLQEAQHINSSLLELGNVIQALAEGNRSHVPFRNSTLTRLLQEGLSGNCKTRLVVCVAPTVKDAHETKCSLNFGSRAMKIQVTAHVNYEVDYKKLAEALAAKLETLEKEWDVQKQDYEEFIGRLRAEIGNRRELSPKENMIVGHKSSPQQVQSLLVLELMTLQLFYNLQNHSQELSKDGESTSKVLLFSESNQDTMLQSMEGLLELLSDYIRGPVQSKQRNHSTQSTSSGHSSVVTSPDCLEQGNSSVLSCNNVPNTLEPVSRFLEHTQINKANLNSNGIDNKLPEPSTGNLSERLKRVVNVLLQLKDTVNSKAVRHLKETFENTLKESDKSIESLNTIDDVVATLDLQKDLLSNYESFDDIQSLENVLYYLLMDKSLLSCMVLLKNQVGNLMEGWRSASQNAFPQGSTTELKRILDELTSERTARDKLQDELYTLQEESIMSEEKLKDIELELKTVRELKENLEGKLHDVESKNEVLGERMAGIEKEKKELEDRIAEIDQKKTQLEANVKNSENNNARKERVIVDLKNEKVALDSLVSTLKEEINILEKERASDAEEKKQIEEELEDLRDRNIILETEWSCCKEENGLLETELTALEEDKAILEDEIGKYREDVKMLEEALNVLEAQATDYKKDIITLKNKEERLILSIRNEKEKFNKELNSLRQEMSTLRVEKRRFQRDISVSRADKSNTERAYNALKSQKDSLQDDVTSYKQEEKRLQREISTLKSEKAKLEREVNGLKTENMKLKNELVHADKIKCDLKRLQKNEEKISSMFNIEKDKIIDSLTGFKDKFMRLESDLNKVCSEKDKLTKHLKRFEHHRSYECDSNLGSQRSQSQPAKATTPDKTGGKNLKTAASVQGALARRSVHSGEVTEVEGKVLDLQRRLAFFMAEKEDIQKELITTRERNLKLTDELKFLEDDTSKIQTLLTTLADEKQNLESRLSKASESKALLEKERDELKDVVTMAQEVTTQLQEQLDVVTEQNRVLEVDHVTLKKSVKTLQNEAVVLNNENKYIKMEFEKVEDDLKTTRSIVTDMNEKISDLKMKVKQAGENEDLLKDQLSSLETENLTLTEQVCACQEEEEVLSRQLSALNEKFQALESTLEKLMMDTEEANKTKDQTTEVIEQAEKLRVKNVTLEEKISDLRKNLEAVVLDAECLKDERVEIERLLSDEEEKTHGGSNIVKSGSLFENICNLKTQVLKVKQEKIHVEEKMKLIEVQIISLGHKNEILERDNMEKGSRLEQEKANYRLHIDKLQQQIEELVKERIQLESEVEFLKKQNSELRRDIAIILDENSKLESELDKLEEEFEQQEKELESATEETKLLLRQLCTAETQNLNFSMQQTSHYDDLEKAKKEVEELKKEKEKIDEEKHDTEVQAKTLKDRLLMAELEISQLKSEHAVVENQRRTLARNLDTADQERALLKSELQGLARALSPLKKEVCEVIKRQNNSHNIQSKSVTNDNNNNNNNTESCTSDERTQSPDGDVDVNLDLSSEVNRMKEDLSVFNEEKAALENEQGMLESRLKEIGDEKEDLRTKLRDLIKDLDESNKLASKENVTEMEDSIRMISSLMNDKDTLEHEKVILHDDLTDAQYDNQILTICVDNLNSELRAVQEELCLANVDRLKLKDRSRNIRKKAAEYHTENGGLKPLQLEVAKLRNDISHFEKSQEFLLQDVRILNEQLNIAENNIFNIDHFKFVIEKHLKQYKERNNKLEAHLRVIYNDLLQMENHHEVPRQSTKVLLETLDLHRYFQTLEEDLRGTESQNRNLKEDAADLLERCNALEEEKQLNTVSSEYIQDSMVGQHDFISQLQNEKQQLAYEKERLQTKLALLKNDKKRMLEDMHRVSRSLGATARYNRELEQKLQAYKVDFSELANKAYANSDTLIYNGLANPTGATAARTDLLCEQCAENVNRKFLGISKNTQLLGDELLDCITDVMSLETAIFTFMEQKASLEHEYCSLDSNYTVEESLSRSGSRSSHYAVVDRKWSYSSIESESSARR